MSAVVAGTASPSAVDEDENEFVQVISQLRKVLVSHSGVGGRESGREILRVLPGPILPSCRVVIGILTEPPSSSNKAAQTPDSSSAIPKEGQHEEEDSYFVEGDGVGDFEGVGEGDDLGVGDFDEEHDEEDEEDEEENGDDEEDEEDEEGEDDDDEEEDGDDEEEDGEEEEGGRDEEGEDVEEGRDCEDNETDDHLVDSYADDEVDDVIDNEASGDTDEVQKMQRDAHEEMHTKRSDLVDFVVDDDDDMDETVDLEIFDKETVQVQNSQEEDRSFATVDNTAPLASGDSKPHRDRGGEVAQMRLELPGLSIHSADCDSRDKWYNAISIDGRVDQDQLPRKAKAKTKRPHQGRQGEENGVGEIGAKGGEESEGEDPGRNLRFVNNLGPLIHRAFVEIGRMGRRGEPPRPGSSDDRNAEDMKETDSSAAVGDGDRLAVNVNSENSTDLNQSSSGHELARDNDQGAGDVHGDTPADGKTVATDNPVTLKADKIGGVFEGTSNSVRGQKYDISPMERILITFRSASALCEAVSVAIERSNDPGLKNSAHLKKERMKRRKKKERKKKKRKQDDIFLIGQHVYGVLTKSALGEIRRWISICSVHLSSKSFGSFLSGINRVPADMFNVTSAPNNPFTATSIQEATLGLFMKLENDTESGAQNGSRRHRVSLAAACDKEVINAIGSYDLNQKMQHFRAVNKLRDELSFALRRRLPHAQLEVYGSCLSDLSLGHSSDVDLSLHIPDIAKLKYDCGQGKVEAKLYEKMLKNAVYDVARSIGLRRDVHYGRGGCRFTEVNAVARARVPVVKGQISGVNNPFSDDGSLKFDICFLNDIAVANSSLIRQYSLVDERVRMLMLGVKKWARTNRVNSSVDGTHSSYTWMNLTIFYLQCIGFLPNFQSEELMMACSFVPDPLSNRLHCIDGLETAFLTWEQVQEMGPWQLPHLFRDTPVTALLYGFFVFYTRVFPSSVGAASIRIGRCALLKTAFASAKVWRICVEDPFEVHNCHRPHDLGMHVTEKGEKRLSRAFAATMEKLDAVFKTPDETTSETAVDVLSALLSTPVLEEVKREIMREMNAGKSKAPPATAAGNQSKPPQGKNSNPTGEKQKRKKPKPKLNERHERGAPQPKAPETSAAQDIPTEQGQKVHSHRGRNAPNYQKGNQVGIRGGQRGGTPKLGGPDADPPVGTRTKSPTKSQTNEKDGGHGKKRVANNRNVRNNNNAKAKDNMNDPREPPDEASKKSGATTNSNNRTNNNDNSNQPQKNNSRHRVSGGGRGSGPGPGGPSGGQKKPSKGRNNNNNSKNPAAGTESQFA